MEIRLQNNLNGVKLFVLESPDDIEQFISYLTSNNRQTDTARLTKIISNMQLPLSILFEPCYVDKLYRDTYYLYYSGKHCEYNRSCQRLSFFNGDFQLNDFYKNEMFRCLSDAFIGTIVLRPLPRRVVGRTLLDPSKLKYMTAHIRTADFSVEILGNIFTVNAFPFLSQDAEVMTCAETTVWNILEYFGTRYPEYKTILPSDIVQKLDDISSERVLPSSGLDYLRITNLLKAFSFAPRLYADTVYNIDELKRLFHYYVESGIPLALGVQGKDRNYDVRHSVICVGHSSKRLPLNDIQIQLSDQEDQDSVPFIDSSQLYNEYVMIDDNQIPYTIEEFNNLTLYDDAKLCVFAAPLYKRIFLEAGDAYSIIHECLKELKIWDFIKAETPDISKENPVVLRLFLTSSRKYKSYRIHHMYPESLRKSYSQVSLPKFLWVAEITTYQLYQQKKVLGEIVIDATSTRTDLSNSIILIKYKSLWGHGTPDKTIEHFISTVNTYDNISEPYEMYVNNLKEINNENI